MRLRWVLMDQSMSPKQELVAMRSSSSLLLAPRRPRPARLRRPPFATRGPSGQITKIAPDGTVSVVATGLTSYLIGGFEATGPAGLVIGADGTLYVSVGGLGPAVATVPAGEYDNRVVAIDEATGGITVLADIGAYELANNPDPNAVDSNVYGMDMGADGLLYVADAGGNAVYSVDPATGDLAVVAVIPGLPLPEEMQQPGGNPGSRRRSGARPGSHWNCGRGERRCLCLSAERRSVPGRRSPRFRRSPVVPSAISLVG